MPIKRRIISALPQTGEVDGSYGVGVDGDYQAGYRGSRTIDHGDGTVTDCATGLMWVKDTTNDLGAPWGARMTWADALSNCEGLSFAGYTDWRLPNVFELALLYDANKTSNSLIDPLVAEAHVGYWTSTTRKAVDTQAGYVSFGSSFIVSVDDKTDTRSCLPVRQGVFNA